MGKEHKGQNAYVTVIEIFPSKTLVSLVSPLNSEKVALRKVKKFIKNTGASRVNIREVGGGCLI